MAMPVRSSITDAAGPSDPKRSRKMAPTAKAMPTGSVADAMPNTWGPKEPDEPPPAQGPKQPAEKPPDHLQTKDKHQDKNKIKIVIKNEDNDWIKAKIAEAVKHDEANAGDDGGRQCGGDDANKFGFEPSWQMALKKYDVDGEAQLQLALLRDMNWYAAAEIVWKLTKKGAYDDDLRNPSGFVNRCCTTAFKNLKW